MDLKTSSFPTFKNKHFKQTVRIHTHIPTTEHKYSTNFRSRNTVSKEWPYLKASLRDIKMEAIIVGGADVCCSRSKIWAPSTDKKWCF